MEDKPVLVQQMKILVDMYSLANSYEDKELIVSIMAVVLHQPNEIG